MQKMLVLSLKFHLEITDCIEQGKKVYCRVYIIFKSKTGYSRGDGDNGRASLDALRAESVRI